MENEIQKLGVEADDAAEAVGVPSISWPVVADGTAEVGIT
jgi:hypothetical protein